MNNYEFIAQWFYYKAKEEGGRWVKTLRVGGYRRYCNLEMDDRAVYSYGKHFPLAVKGINGFILNADRYSHSTSLHQYHARDAANVIYEKYGIQYAGVSYNALAMAGIKPENLEIVDKREDRWKEVKYTDKDGKEHTRWEHLVGAALFKDAVNRVYLLSSTDASAHWGRGYFLSVLPCEVNTIDEAFEALKPEIVKQSEKEGKEVRRQGEWFFIKLADNVRELKKVLKETGFNQVKLFKILATCSLKWKKLEGRDWAGAMNTFLNKETVDRFFRKREPHHIVSKMKVIEGITDKGTKEVLEFYSGTVRHRDSWGLSDHKMLKLGKGWWAAAENMVSVSSSKID